jgi:hypothetical protein
MPQIDLATASPPNGDKSSPHMIKLNPGDVFAAAKAF